MPFILAGKNDKELNLRLLSLAPPALKVKLLQKGKLGFFPEPMQKLLMGRDYNTVNNLSKNQDTDDAKLRANADKINLQNEHLIKNRQPSNAITSTDANSDNRNLGHDLLSIVFREKWKSFSSPLALSEGTPTQVYSHFFVMTWISTGTMFLKYVRVNLVIFQTYMHILRIFTNSKSSKSSVWLIDSGSMSIFFQVGQYWNHDFEYFASTIVRIVLAQP